MSVGRAIQVGTHAPLGGFGFRTRIRPSVPALRRVGSLATMSTTTGNADKRIDRRDWTDRDTRDDIATDECHDADYLGRDNEGVHHYWSIYEQTVVVIDADAREVATVRIPGDTGESDISKLGDWVRYTDEERGWSELYWAESLGDMLVENLR